jgi:alpha-N-acetylglucosamine transferase
MKKYAYVCVLSTDNYLDGALILNENLRELNSKYELLCVVNDRLSEESINTLHRFGIKTKNTRAIKTNMGIGRWNYTFDKLNIFSLVEYDKIVFLDLDLLILKNIDHLFDWDSIAAGLDMPWHDDEFNSGVMVIEPNMDLYNDMIEKLYATKYNYTGDQDFLNDYFGKNFIALPLKYNLMRTLYLDSELLYKNCTKRGVYKYIKNEPKDAVIIHYIRSLKPFMDKIPFNDEYYLTYKKYMDLIKAMK